MRDQLRSLRGVLRRELDAGVPVWIRPSLVRAVDDVTRRLGSSLHIGREPDRDGDVAAVARATALLEVLSHYRAAQVPRDGQSGSAS